MSNIKDSAGIKINDIQVASATGELYQTGTKIDSTAAELNLLKNNSTQIPAASMWATCPQIAALDPSVAHGIFDDFYSFVPNNLDQTGWIVTKVEGGSGTASLYIVDAAGGGLKIVNDNADDDSVQIQYHAETFKFVAAKPLWFETRLKVSDALQSDLIVGLCVTDTTILGGVSDGAYFCKHDGDANIDVVTIKDSTGYEGTAKGVLVNDTYIKLGFYWNGVSTVYFYINGTLVGTSTSNIAYDEEYAISLAFQNGEAAAKTIYVDYIKVFQIR